MGLLKKYFNQTRKPEGFLGKLMLNSASGRWQGCCDPADVF